MADDERRAEIEAVARIVRDESPYAMKHSTATRIAERAIAALARCRALDRVRDARGDDEAALLARIAAWIGREWPIGLVSFQREFGPARSPQGEDHEAGIEAAVRGWQAAANAGHTRTEVLLRRAIQDYLSRVSPSRDGTVAVEQPEPDALGGLPPSQPKEDG